MGTTTKKIAKPNFNSYYGKLKLISANYKLEKEVSGWWDTFKWMDMDLSDTLPVKHEVVVWFSDKQQMYIVVAEKVRDCAFTKNVNVLFTAYIKKEDGIRELYINYEKEQAYLEAEQQSIQVN